MPVEAKLFFEVFPELNMDKELSSLFEDTMIEKVVMKQAERQLIISLLSKHLISRPKIVQVEDIICGHLFRGRGYKVIIDDRYELSSQYNTRTLTEVYKDSILYDVEKISHVGYRLLKRAEWYYADDIITLAMEDSKLSKSHSIGIKKYLEETYKKRFGMDIKVGFDYTESDKEMLRRANEQKMKLEIEAILSNVHEDADLTLDGKSVDKKKLVGEGKKDVPAEKKAPAQDEKPKETFAARRKKYTSNDPDVFYGRDCEGELVKISTLVDGIGEVCIHGQLIKMEEKVLRNGKTLFICNITDFEDTIAFKIFASEDDAPVYKDELKEGSFYRLKGVPLYDTFSKELNIASVRGIKHIPDFRVPRVDTSLEKRVELHMHTVMSEMDSVVDIEKIVKRANDWGHPAIAITDHGVAQAFPIAAHAKGMKDGFKLIFGCEGYFVDDLKNLVINPKGQDLNTEYIVFDIETTGLSQKKNKIIEIGAVKVKDGEEIDRFSEFINPEEPIPYSIEQLTSITDEMVMHAPTVDVILPKFLEFCGDDIVVAHNAAFDTGFIKKNAKDLGMKFDNTIMDTMTLSHVLLPELGKFTLDRVCKALNVKNEHHHRAVDDANATAKIFVKLYEMLVERGVKTVEDVNELGSASDDTIKKGRTYHGIILAKNEIGRVNLYRLISEAHVRYFNRRPRMPMSMINKYREGLILGSACEAGELFRAVVDDAPDEEIARLVNFFDYLEIQPIGNNEFMTRKKENPCTIEDLQNYNKRIVELGRLFNKPVVATCDVHFLDPEDSIYRAIIMKSKGFEDAVNQPPLYFRTTEEMLAEFEYLGSEKAREVVITNTNLIADMVEYMDPVRPDKAPPIIENSDETLTNICYEKAHKIYGPDLPEVVVERLERELHSIISNGFAVMYIIAQKLVWDSNDHGYLVGSRGSVGSSFVATMAGITEVNPLSAHYICPECHFVDFDSELVKSYSGMSGCDMPDRDCPRCGHPLIKEGHDIPFETFLGFKGDKEPDIDLNFSGEYQSCAHAYTEVLFGKGKAFRAGTVTTVADKTAYGYVYNYFKDLAKDEARAEATAMGDLTQKEIEKYVDEKAIVTKRSCEMERLAIGCTGVKRSTGQHPGGMIVLPRHEEIYSFTPIQKPANDMTTDVVTSHFEYHSIDHNLLKLDILGHDDPTMIRRLEDLTGLDATTIRLDDPDVMALFHGTESLHITPEDINGIPLGSLGVPEFGTDFAMQMLIDANPQNFSDLVRIAGLAHGTDVWLGNAQELIKSGQCTISTAICCRDDIMVYLINQGLEQEASFKIMEGVRKGKGLTDEQEQMMRDHNVPDWYIWSCKQIKYMFPKAHAVAYVLSAIRVAWWKLYYPREYYAVYFSTRCDFFDIETLVAGKDAILSRRKEIEMLRENRQSSNKDEGLWDVFEIALEMIDRGFHFSPLNLEKSDANKFILDPDDPSGLLPPFSSVDSLGESVANTVIEARKHGSFLSKEDVIKRTKLNNSHIKQLTKMGVFDGMQEENQLSLF